MTANVHTLTLYSPSGVEKCSFFLTEKSKGTYTLGSEDKVVLSFSLAEPVQIEVGDWCDLTEALAGTGALQFAKKYHVIKKQSPSYNTSTGGWDYDVEMHAYYYLWQNKLFKYEPTDGGSETSWSLVDTLANHLGVFLRNLEYDGFFFGEDTSFQYSIDGTVKSDARLLSYDSTYLVDALTMMAEEWECEWWVTENVIHFGRCEHGDAVDIEIGAQAYKIDRSESQGDYANRLYVFGSERNIPDNYRKHLVFEATTVSSNTMEDSARPLYKSYFSTDDYDYYITKGLLASTSDEGIETASAGDRAVTVQTSAISLTAGAHTVKIGTLVAQVMAESGIDQVDFTWKITYDGTEKTVLTGTQYFLIHSRYYTLPVFEDYEFYLDSDVDEFYLSLELQFVNESGSSVVSGYKWYNTAQVTTADPYPSISSQVTFTSGTYEGETVEATINASGTEDDRSLVTLPSGYAPSVGDKYTIDNIISEDVPSSYFSLTTSEETVVNGVVQTRLMLPEGAPYIDLYRYLDGAKVNIGTEEYDDESAEEMPAEEVVEGVVVTDDIYPRTNLKVTSVTYYEDEIMDEDGEGTGEYQRFYRLTCKHVDDDGENETDFNFSYYYILDGETLSAIFKSGLLNGMEFEVAFNPDGEAETDSSGNWNEDAQVYELVMNDTYGRDLPDTLLYPEEGDIFVLSGWNSDYMSSLGLVEAAEQELYEYGVEYAEKTVVDDGTYDATLLPKVVEESVSDSSFGYVFSVGQAVNLICPAYFGNGRESRVLGYEICLDIPCDHPVYTIGESVKYTRLGAIEDKVSELQYLGGTYVSSGATSGSGVYLIKTKDSTAASDTNAYSALRSIKEFLSATGADTASGLITFLKGLKSGTFVSGSSGAYVDSAGNTEIESLLVRAAAEIKGALSTTSITNSGDIVTENLTVTGKATFFELVIDKIKAAGGATLFTPADGFEVEAVEYDPDSNAYTLKWQATDGEKSITNMWEAGDQAICQTFNAAEGTTYNVSNKLWWALVTAAGRSVDDDGVMWNYIVVDFDDVSDGTGDSVPEVGDAVAMLGSRSEDTARQSAVYISAYASLDKGLTAPLIATYRGIDDYDLESHRYFKSDAVGVTIKGELISTSGGNEYPVKVYVGEWDEDTEYSYYNEVTHDGGTYLCVSHDGCVGVEPGTDGAVWLCTSEPDPVYMDVLVDGVSMNYVELAYGESVNIECRLMRGWNEYSGTPDAWSIVRDSGDEADDAAWLLRDKVQSFAGSITLCYGPDESDLPSDTAKVSATFTITASEGGTSIATVEITI